MKDLIRQIRYFINPVFKGALDGKILVTGEYNAVTDKQGCKELAFTAMNLECFVEGIL